MSIDTQRCPPVNIEKFPVGLLKSLVSSGFFGQLQNILQMFIGIVVMFLALGILGWIPFHGAIRLLTMQVLRKGYASSRTKGPKSVQC